MRMTSMNRAPVVWLVVSLFGSTVLGQGGQIATDTTGATTTTPANVECGAWLMGVEVADNFPVISPTEAPQSGSPTPLPATPAGCLERCKSTPGCNAVNFQTGANVCNIMTVPLFQPSKGRVGSQLYRMCPEPACGEWGFGLEYVGPLLAPTDSPVAQQVESADQCKELCLSNYYCDVATFYDRDRECALRMIPGASLLKRSLSSDATLLKRGVHSLRKCVPNECGVWIPRVEYKGGTLESLGTVDVRSPDPSVDSPQEECERRCRLHGDCHAATFYPTTNSCKMWKEGWKVSTRSELEISTIPVFSYSECGNGDEDDDADMGDGGDDGEADGAVEVQDPKCGKKHRKEGRYRNHSGCAMYELAEQKNLNKCRNACEKGGFKFCSWHVDGDATGNTSRCAGFFEEQERPGSCIILDEKNWQRRWDSFETCSPWKKQHEQCGGIGYTGQTKCLKGLQCVADGPHWHACMPKDQKCPNKLYDQCGGKEFDGHTCCPTNAVCSAQNAYYSQCRSVMSLSKEEIEALKDEF